MCGRFGLWHRPGTVSRCFKVPVPLDLPPRYNVAPGREILVIRKRPGAVKESAQVKWGLVPGWAENASIGRELVRAPLESASQEPAFMEALRFRRCLIPASGFYAWLDGSGEPQPFLFIPRETELLAIGGMWETWQPPRAASPFETCALLTRGPDPAAAETQSRLPVLIDSSGFDQWIDPCITEPAELHPLMRPCTPHDLQVRRVDSRLEEAEEGDSSIIEPAAAANESM
jgi:putative SOS response-associated peptidase YedK